MRRLDELIDEAASNSDEDEDDTDYEPSEGSEETSADEEEVEEQEKLFDIDAFNRSRKLWDESVNKTGAPKATLGDDSHDSQPAAAADSSLRAVARKFDESSDVPSKVRVQTDPKVASVSSSDASPASAKPQGKGIGLGRLGEKRKLNILETSRLQWNSFKEETGIQDELEAHNRSKNSYLDKQEFLARTDYKQYMIMRDKSSSTRK